MKPAVVTNLEKKVFFLLNAGPRPILINVARGMHNFPTISIYRKVSWTYILFIIKDIIPDIFKPTDYLSTVSFNIQPLCVFLTQYVNFCMVFTIRTDYFHKQP